MKRSKELIAVAGLLLLSACSSTGSKPLFPASSGTPTQLNIITAPVGLNLDNRPGLDGFSVKVYANAGSNPKTVSIRSGMLEVLMFDGTFYGRTTGRRRLGIRGKRQRAALVL